MELGFLLTSIVKDIGKILLKKDIALVQEFLDHDEPGLAVEHICDKLVEYNLAVSESTGKMLTVACDKLGIDRKAWWPLVVKDSVSHQLVRLAVLIYGVSTEETEPQPETIFEKTKKYLTPAAISEIGDYIQYGELELAVDTLCYCLIKYRVPITKKDVDKLLTIWLDLGNNPMDWAGFNIVEDNI
jgi:hypothetical protein